jgi:hypothetical protein
MIIYGGLYIDPSLVPSNEILLLPAKIAELCSFLVIAIMMRKRGKPSLPNSFYLSRTLSNAFFAWAVYVSCDIPIYLFAALSFNPAVPTPISGVTGYPLAYPSLIVANILRDIGMTFGQLNFILILFATYQIRHGEAAFKKNVARSPIFIIIISVYLTVSGIFDGIQVVINPSTVGVSAVFSGMSLIMIIIMISAYFYSAIKFKRALFEGIEEAERPLKRRLVVLSLGILLLGIGHAYWLVLGILRFIPALVLFLRTNASILSMIGHLIWACSPILIFFSLRTSQSSKDLASTGK